LAPLEILPSRFFPFLARGKVSEYETPPFPSVLPPRRSVHPFFLYQKAFFPVLYISFPCSLRGTTSFSLLPPRREPSFLCVRPGSCPFLRKGSLPRVKFYLCSLAFPPTRHKTRASPPSPRGMEGRSCTMSKASFFSPQGAPPQLSSWFIFESRPHRNNVISLFFFLRSPHASGSRALEIIHLPCGWRFLSFSPSDQNPGEFLQLSKKSYPSPLKGILRGAFPLLSQEFFPFPAGK